MEGRSRTVAAPSCNPLGCSGHVISVLPYLWLLLAAISFLVGALVSRLGWIAVGKVSGSDPESVFAAERY